VLRSLTGTPTVLAVSHGQAYVGLETPPATTSLVVASIATPSDPSRTLWSESAQQTSTAQGFPGVQRQLDATSAVFGHLEIGAGGDYIALTTRAQFYGAAVWDVGFPDMTVDTEELRVFAAASGGIVQRYRSWCAGTVKLDPNSNEISDWGCAVTPGQTAAVTGDLEHHIDSMTFLFGKK